MRHFNLDQVDKINAQLGQSDDRYYALSCAAGLLTGQLGAVVWAMSQTLLELGIKSIAGLTRDDARIAVRFPCILRRREDKPGEEADTLDTLKGLLAAARP